MLFKRFLLGLLIVILVAVTGFTSGYYSDMVLDRIIPAVKLTNLNKYLDKLKNNQKQQSAPPEKGAPDASGEPEAAPPQFISEGEAVTAVKNVPLVREKVAGTKGTAFSFQAQTAPTATSPVWVIAMAAGKQETLDRDILFQVDAITGQVLEIQEADLTLAGLKIGYNRRQVEEVVGQAVKVHKSYDQEIGQNVRTFESDSLTVEWGKKTGAFAISVKSSGIATTRGLQVGDALEKAYRLYGRPVSEQGGLAAYKYIMSEKEVFFIKAEKNKITEIKIAATSR